MFQILWLITNLFGRLDFEMPDINPKESVQDMWGDLLDTLEKQISSQVADLTRALDYAQHQADAYKIDYNSAIERLQQAETKYNQQLSKNSNQFLASRLLDCPGEWKILLGTNLSTHIDGHLNTKNPLEAIKLLRMTFNLGLKEAKDCVDARVQFLRPIPF